MTAVMPPTTAPLSHFLTRFSAPPPAPTLRVVEREPLPTPEATVTLTEAELEARLAAAAEAARSEAQRQHAAELAETAAAHEAALHEAVALARSEWTDAEGKQLAAQIDAQLGELRHLVGDRLARVLRPLLTETVRAQTIQALTDAIDRLLADPSEPAIRVCGPEDLLTVLRAARPAPGIDWVAAYQTDVTITTAATRIETRLGLALADIEATEG